VLIVNVETSLQWPVGTFLDLEYDLCWLLVTIGIKVVDAFDGQCSSHRPTWSPRHDKMLFNLKVF
jgi:hypothetical protein